MEQGVAGVMSAFPAKGRSTSTDAFRRAEPSSPRVSIVVPALNEALNLSVVLPQLPEVHEVILVDGGSVDGSVAAARRALPGIIVVRQTRKGKGNALAAGFAQVTGDIVVMFDADGSADPLEIERFVSVLTDGADFAKGSRFIEGGGSADITPIRRVGNMFLNTIFNVGFESSYRDLCYGYNAFWADMIPLLDLPDHTLPAPADGKMMWGDGFEIETVINCRFAASGAEIVEVPSVEKMRLFGESNLHAVSDGLRVLKTLLTEWRRARAIRRMERKLRLDEVVQHPEAVPAAGPTDGRDTAQEDAKLVA